MSVTSGFIFSKDEGAIIADAMFSYGDRHYINLTKLQAYQLPKKNFIFTLSGVGDGQFLIDIINFTSRFVKSNQDAEFESADELLLAMREPITQIKEDRLNTLLLNHTGISLDEFRLGRGITKNQEPFDIPPEAKDFYEHIITGDHPAVEGLIGSEIMSLAYTPQDGVSLHILKNFSDGTFRRTIVPYKSVGSGSDMADAVLSDFYEKHEKDQLQNINKYDGLVSLFQATDKAAHRNAGVGGIYGVVIISGGQLITPHENNIKLSTEIVKGYKKKYLPKDFTHDALESLLYQDAPYLSWERKMWQVAGPQKNEFSRLLRGYHV